MISLKMVTFCKDKNCPSSPQLLAFQNADCSPKEVGKVARHLALCEFCASEVEFYAHYPPSEENIAKVEIPNALYELAAALLGNKHKEFSTLNQLLGESESVKI